VYGQTVFKIRIEMEDVTIGLALGVGAARGWAHIGIIRGLIDIGIQPDIVCGTSAGALVGGSYAAGHLEELEKWLLTLDRLSVARFFDLSLTSGGLIAGKRIIGFFIDRFGDYDIQSLPKTYGAVATDLMTGHEIWFRSGSLMDAVRASISMPGIFEPFYLDGKWYVDGGIVNPVPVSLCRYLGADVVIAVDVNRGRLRKSPETSKFKFSSKSEDETVIENDDDRLPVSLPKKVKDRIGNALSHIWQGNSTKPGLLFVLNNSAHFMQERITLSRLACDPPDFILHPNVSAIGFMDFHRAAEAIEVGKQCVRNNERDLTHCLDKK
jgi:NTE family protein